jgi:hypothetical protein
MILTAMWKWGKESRVGQRLKWLSQNYVVIVKLLGKGKLE